jgi:APA family basic amino acid/polyamine antiporter
MPFIPILAMMACLGLMAFLPFVTWIRFVVWTAVGIAVYFGYSVRHSRLAASSSSRQ